MTATVTRVTTRREAQVFLELDEPVDVDMLPMPMRLDPDVNPDPVVRAVVTLRTEDGRPLQPLLTLATARGRYVHAGIGQNPDERDDAFLEQFADLIDAARERVAYLDTPPAPADPPRHDLGSQQGHHTKRPCGCTVLAGWACTKHPETIGPRIATVRHLGATDTPALHVCRHHREGHPCACTLGTDHPADQPATGCDYTRA